jgi:hypothetical protein
MFQSQRGQGVPFLPISFGPAFSIAVFARINIIFICLILDYSATKAVYRGRLEVTFNLSSKRGGKGRACKMIHGVSWGFKVLAIGQDSGVFSSSLLILGLQMGLAGSVCHFCVWKPFIILYVLSQHRAAILYHCRAEHHECRDSITSSAYPVNFRNGSGRKSVHYMFIQQLLYSTFSESHILRRAPNAD